VTQTRAGYQGYKYFSTAKVVAQKRLNINVIFALPALLSHCFSFVENTKVFVVM